MDYTKLELGKNITYQIPKQAFATVSLEEIKANGITDILDIFMVIWLNRALMTSYVKDGVVSDVTTREQQDYINDVAAYVKKAYDVNKIMPDEKIRSLILSKLCYAMPKTFFQCLSAEQIDRMKSYISKRGE